MSNIQGNRYKKDMVKEIAVSKLNEMKVKRQKASAFSKNSDRRFFENYPELYSIFETLLKKIDCVSSEDIFLYYGEEEALFGGED